MIIAKIAVQESQIALDEAKLTQYLHRTSDPPASDDVLAADQIAINNAFFKL